MQIRLRKMIVATLLSVPLLPLLVLPDRTSDYLTARDVLLLAPCMLEFFVFYALYKFSLQQAVYSKYEQKLLLLLSSGLFVLLGVPIVITSIARPVSGVSTAGFILVMVYAFVSLIVGTRKITHSRKEIGTYFNKHFAWPAVGAVIIMIAMLLAASVTLNLAVLYFTFKNFSQVVSAR